MRSYETIENARTARHDLEEKRMTTLLIFTGVFAILAVEVAVAIMIGR